MLSLQEKLFIIDNSNSLLELNKEVLPTVHKQNYYFVSYSHKDYKSVLKDILLLQECGINIWYDSDMHIGENWEELAQMYISKYECKGIIFYLSKNSILSNACNKEVEYVLENNKQFFSINIPLQDNNNINNNNIYRSGYEMLIELKEAGYEVSDELIENFKKAFPSTNLYLSYYDAIERKKEQIEKLVGEEVFDFKLNDNSNLSEDKSIKLSFCKDNSLVKVNLKSKYLFNDEYVKLEKIGECVFTNLIQLREVELSKSIKEIDNRAFYNCIKLNKINLDNDFTLIGDYAFSNCKKLKLESITADKIGKNAFSNCDSIEKIEVNSRVLDEYVFENCVNLTEVTLKEDKILQATKSSDSMKLLTTTNLFNRGIFNNCINLKTIIYNNQINEFCPRNFSCLPPEAFYKCHSLEHFSLRGKLDISNASSAFRFCKNLKKINLFTVYNSNIPSFMFADCVSLTEVNGLKNYDSINAYAFHNCINLSNVDLENTTSVSNKAFENTNLKILNLPNIVSIYDNAFSNINNLFKIYLGENIKTIETKAFSNCKNLKEIEILGSDVNINSLAFENVYPEVLTISSNSVLDALKDNLNNLKVLYALNLTKELETVILDLKLIKSNSDKNGFLKYIKNDNI